MGFENEKDHPEVAPSQFEMNFGYSEAIVAADQIQLYKLVCRQVAAQMELTASFLPKPVTGVNGSGMHTNISLAKKGKNLFHDKAGEDGLSKAGWDFVDRVLNSANDLCLVLNPSVNAYRRLDPHYEAPNQIKASANNRGAMVRIPYGNERSARIEVRSVAPDANPYLLLYSLLRTGLEGAAVAGRREPAAAARASSPTTSWTRSASSRRSPFMTEILGEQVQTKFAELEDRLRRALPEAAGQQRQAGGDPVPPRGDQPVPVVSVLGG